MSKAETERLVKYMRKMQARLGLNEWRISLEIWDQTELPSTLGLESSGSIGHIQLWRPQHSAAIHVVAHPRDLSIRQVIRHELAHLVLQDMWEAVKIIHEELGRGTWQVLENVYEQAEEIAANRIMRALA